MKKLFIILAIAAGSCTVSNRAPSLRLTVTYLHREGENTEVLAKGRHSWYEAKCKDLPDTVKLGTVITVLPTKKPDTCKYVFKLLK